MSRQGHPEPKVLRSPGAADSAVIVRRQVHRCLMCVLKRLRPGPSASLAQKLATKLAEERGARPLPLGITPHKLRHTFASIQVAIGKDPTYVMQQLGHTDPAFTLRVYAHVMRRSDEERQALKALVEGRVLAGKRQGTPDPAPHGARQDRS